MFPRRFRYNDADGVEVDAFSLWNLIINYKHLISRGGPDMTYEETKELLETMIEDARRLCIRSPILFRMSTRAKIINSDNTRYGADHGPMFRTLTTSKGIKEIISLSSSYYNSLDPTGEDDTTQQFIRPRFLQMMVLVCASLCHSWEVKPPLGCMIQKFVNCGSFGQWGPWHPMYPFHLPGSLLMVKTSRDYADI